LLVARDALTGVEVAEHLSGERVFQERELALWVVGALFAGYACGRCLTCLNLRAVDLLRQFSGGVFADFDVGHLCDALVEFLDFFGECCDVGGFYF
jgi:hypothetical protein